MSAAKAKQVQTFGRKRHAVAVAVCKEGSGLLRLNGQPLHLVEPAILRVKVMEPVLILGRERFGAVDIRMRVKGGGHSSQVYAIRQALAKAIVSYYQKCALVARSAAGGRRPSACRAGCCNLPPCRAAPPHLIFSASHTAPSPPAAARPADVDEAAKKEVKDVLLGYDRTLLVADPRHREPKKFGGSARAKYQKSYR